MVDLQPSGPAMGTGHPWLKFSRWAIAWRVWVAGTAVSAAAILLLTLGSMLDNPRVSIIEVPLGWLTVFVVPLVVFAVSAALLGPWLRRFYSFTQSLLFAGITVVAVWGVLLIIDFVTHVGAVCEPNTYCARFGEMTVWVSVLYLGPLFLIAAITYGLTLWAARNPRRQRIFIITCAAVLSVFLMLWVAALSGNFTTAPSSAPTTLAQDGTHLPHGMCADYDAAGRPITVQCTPG